jgi:branched-chain amino acid transport system substrate-binding protein
MSKRLLVLIGLLVTASMIVSACAPGAAPEAETAMFECEDAIGCAEVGPSDPVHLAFMGTISGATSYLGEDSLGGVEIAIDDRDGELLGHTIQLTIEDSGCSAEGGQTAASKVASDPTILGVIGTNCSSAATAATTTISTAGLSMLSPSNTAPALTIEGETWQPGYYRVCHTDLFQGAVAAEFAYNELDARTAATIHDGSPYADQLQQVMANRFTELGGTVTFQGAVNVGDTDMRAVLTTVAADQPDVLYFPIFEPEGDFIVAQSSDIEGLENTAMVGADGLLAASMPENAGPNSVGMYLSGPYVKGAFYDEFLEKWDAKYGGTPPSAFHAFAYDATNMLMDAIEDVAVQAEDGTLYVGRQAIRDKLSNLVGYAGLTGNLDCTDKNFPGVGVSHGDCGTGEALAIFQIGEDQLAGVWPPEVVYTP